MSESNKTTTRYVKELVPGVTPNSPAFRNVLLTGSSLTFSPDSVQDDSVTPDRQIEESKMVGYTVEGENTHRLRFLALDDHFELSFMNVFTNKPTLLPTGFTATAGTYAVASGGAAFLANHLILASGFSNSANNGVKKVASSTGTTIVVGASGVDEPAPPVGASIKVVGYEGASADIKTAIAPFRLLSTSLDFTTLGLLTGDWIKVGGSAIGNKFATAACNGWVRISAVAAGTLTLDSVPTGWAADVGTGKTIRFFMGDRLRNGTVDSSFTYEREIIGDDNITRYRYFRGCRLGMSMSVAAKQLAELSFTIMAMSSSRLETTRHPSATDSAAISGEIYDGSNNVKEIRLGGIQLINPNIPISVSLEIDNSFRGRDGLGALGYVGVKAGTLQATGGLEAYLGDGTMINLLQDQGYFPLSWPTLALDGSSGYFWDVPRAKFTDGGEEIEGRDTDLQPDLQYLGHKTQNGTSYTVQLQRFAYLEVS